MIIPVRCFTCNQVIAHLWEKYQEQIQLQYMKENIPEDSKKRFVDIDELEKKTLEGKILDEMNIHKYCCRRICS